MMRCHNVMWRCRDNHRSEASVAGRPLIVAAGGDFTSALAGAQRAAPSAAVECHPFRRIVMARWCDMGRTVTARWCDLRRIVVAGRHGITMTVLRWPVAPKFLIFDDVSSGPLRYDMPSLGVAGSGHL